MTYCTHDQTALSSHEVAQGYKNVKDLSAVVKFQLTNSKDTYFLSWTTTLDFACKCSISYK